MKNLRGVWMAVLIAGGSASASAAPLKILTESTPPASMMVDGIVSGRETAKVREMMRRTGIAYDIELLPWKRAYISARENQDTCLYSTTRTPEREALFRWVGPTAESSWQLWGTTARGIRLHTLEDAKAYRIGTYVGDARDAYLRERGYLVEAVSNDLLNPHKLLLNRIDLWAVAVRRGSEGPSDPAWRGKVMPLLTFETVQVYLACNRSVPDTVIHRLNDVVREMWRDGTMARISHAYDRWAPLP